MTSDLFSKKKREISRKKSKQTKGDTYRPEPAYSPKSSAFFFGKVKLKHKPVLQSGWRVLKQCRNVRTGHLDVVCSRGGLFKQKTERRPTAVSVSAVSSVDGSLFTVFLCVLLCILHETRTIFAVFLGQVGPQRMLRLRGAHQTNETLKHLRREGTTIYVIYAQRFSYSWYHLYTT